MSREALIKRATRETDITIHLFLDGSGQSDCSTGIGFFDHMLHLFACHGLFDLKIKAEGDLHVDFHHTVEDVGIVLGLAFQNALGEKARIQRYGLAYVPMDDALARVVVDLSGRPFLSFKTPENIEPIGSGFSFQLVEEFCRALSTHSKMNLHVSILSGKNSHHLAEAIFKALGKSLDQATAIDPRLNGVRSTKGTLTE